MRQWQLIAAIAFFLFAYLPAQSQDCPGLSVEGLWLDPFNASLVHVLCQNTNFDEIYSYPSWHILDDSGTLMGTEEVMYFGIADWSHHVIELINPWPDEPVSVPVELELWVGFDEALMCSYQMEFVPREWEWTGTGNQGCLPVVCTVFGYAGGEGVEVGLELLNGSQNVLLNADWSTEASNNFWVQSDSMCLSQFECFTLDVSANTADYLTVSLSDGSHSSWLQHWTQTLDASSASLDTTFTLDLYGGDCDASGLEGSNLNLSGVTIYPNPVRSNETVYIRDGHSDLDLQISLLNALGQEVRRIPLGSSSFEAPAIPGLYWVMRQQKTALPLLIR
ncbi:hypothetical protein N9233_01445 [Flavobacteriales bacterium]|nr:hypothetical protein [Flavobacteriales bacterium]